MQQIIPAMNEIRREEEAVNGESFQPSGYIFDAPLVLFLRGRYHQAPKK